MDPVFARTHEQWPPTSAAADRHNTERHTGARASPERRRIAPPGRPYRGAVACAFGEMRSLDEKCVRPEKALTCAYANGNARARARAREAHVHLFSPNTPGRPAADVKESFSTASGRLRQAASRSPLSPTAMKSRCTLRVVGIHGETAHCARLEHSLTKRNLSEV